MMIHTANVDNLADTAEEQLVYSHLLYWIKLESPEKMLERFRALFLQGFEYGDWQVQLALDRIVGKNDGGQQFRFFFNRCCHILINRWQSHAQDKYAIPAFFELLEQPLILPIAGTGRSGAVRRLRLQVKEFLNSDHYQKMRRMVEFLLGDADARGTLAGQRPLLTLIRRYPYLYPHCLISEDSTSEQRQSILLSQGQAQKQHEVALAQFLTSKFRQREGKIQQAARNPTLLTDKELITSMQHFVGKVDQRSSYRDQSYRFVSHCAQTQSSKAFKQDLHAYLTSGSDTTFGGGRFHRQLEQYLKALPQDGQQFNEFQLVRACSQVLNFLVVESPQEMNHFTFIDLLNNMGTTRTVGLLLKIVLACKKVKPYLEKRFAILFHHYENHSRSSVGWLVHCLEHLNVAWSTHFGDLDFSYVTQLPH
jgi:hypothetical protein